MSVRHCVTMMAALGLWLATSSCTSKARSADTGVAGGGAAPGAVSGEGGGGATSASFGTSSGGVSGSAAGVLAGAPAMMSAGAGGLGPASHAAAGAGGTMSVAGAGVRGEGGASGTAPNAGSGGASGATGGAGTAGMPASGMSGGDAFKPCPSTGACKILPFGDSITYGLQSPDGGGYRAPLFHLALMNGKTITFVGSQKNGPMTVDGQPFPANNEGYSGWTIAQLGGLVPMPALNSSPNIVLLHIGTNDMYMTPAGAPDRLATLIDHIISAAPNSLLVVAQIIPLASGDTTVQSFNAAIPAIVQKRADDGKHIILVDQHTGFPTSELADGVHPNGDGYKRMADKWFAAISGYLN